MTGPVEALRRRLADGLPEIHSNREIAEYLAAARMGRTDQPAAEPTPEVSSWASRVRDRAAAVYGRVSYRGGPEIGQDAEDEYRQEKTL